MRYAVGEAAAAQLGERAQRAHEDLLRRVARPLLVAEEVAAAREHPRRVPAVELLDEPRRRRRGERAGGGAGPPSRDDLEPRHPAYGTTSVEYCGSPWKATAHADTSPKTGSVS